MCQKLAVLAWTNDGTTASPLPLSICPLSQMCVWVSVCVHRQGSSCWLKATPPPLPHKAPQKKTAGNMNHCQVGPDEDTGSVSPEFTGLIWQPSCDPLSGTCHVCRVWAYSHANDVRFGQNVNETRHTVQGSKPDRMTVVSAHSWRWNECDIWHSNLATKTRNSWK